MLWPVFFRGTTLSSQQQCSFSSWREDFETHMSSWAPAPCLGGSGHPGGLCLEMITTAPLIIREGGAEHRAQSGLGGSLWAPELASLTFVERGRS